MSAGSNLHHSAQTAPLTVASRSTHSGVANLPVAGLKAETASAAAAADAKEGASVKPGLKQVKQSLEDINKVLTSFSISVQFQIDPDFKELIVKVVDQDTGKLIRQIPTEEVVSMSKAMDNLKGLLFAQSV